MRKGARDQPRFIIGKGLRALHGFCRSQGAYGIDQTAAGFQLSRGVSEQAVLDGDMPFDIGLRDTPTRIGITRPSAHTATRGIHENPVRLCSGTVRLRIGMFYLKPIRSYSLFLRPSL